MHSFGITHGSITPDTVVLNDSLDSGCLDLYPESRLVQVPEYSAELNASPRYQPLDRVSLEEELLPATAAADVYSLGLVVWFMLVKKKPFAAIPWKNIFPARSRLLNDYLPEPENCPFDFDIVRSCCALDPSSRPSAAQVVELFDRYTIPTLN